MKTLFTKAQITEKQDDVFTAVASTSTEDRQGEVVSVEGWNLKNYKENPILLFMHDHNKPLGKATRIWIDKAGAKPKMMFKGFISTATDYGRAAKQLMEEGILNSFSVGFRPLEIDGNTITKSELYEISLVSVPANPDARLVAMKSLQGAGIDEEVIKEFVPDERGDEDEQTDEEIAELKAKVNRLEDQVQLAVKGLQYLAPHRSNGDATKRRLDLSRVIARTSEKLVTNQIPRGKVVDSIKVIKKSSEKLIRELKGDL